MTPGFIRRLFVGRNQRDVGLAEPAVHAEFGYLPAAIAFGSSDCGLKRQNNEDCYLCLPERLLYCVFDGMGGMACGERASDEARRVVEEYLTDDVIRQAVQIGPVQVAQLFESVLLEANNKLLTLAAADASLSGMGTTAVLAIISGSMLYCSNLGDSRSYVLHDKSLVQISEDHSVAAESVARGEMTAEQSRKHPHRNRLTRCLGRAQCFLPSFNAINIHPGDRILLCSDGLWDMLADREIEQVLNSSSSVETAVRVLINLANRAGGADNITAIVVAVPDNAGRDAMRLETADVETLEADELYQLPVLDPAKENIVPDQQIDDFAAAAAINTDAQLPLTDLTDEWDK